MYKIKVSNIPRWVSELDLKHFFHGCGDIKQAVILASKITGQSTSVGCVIFATEQAMQQALLMSGAKLDGAEIKVDALNQDDRIDEDNQKSRKN
jgi:hypothetical protein